MFFWAQVRKPVKNDWAVIARDDLIELEIDESFEQIESYSKYSWKSKIKKVIKENAFLYLKSEVKERKIF